MWVKLGDEYPDEAWNLTDAAWRTHTEALLWSSKLGLNLVVPKRHLPRFAFSEHAAEATAELCATGWWKDAGDFWDIGQRFPEWQLEREVVEHRRASNALRQRRHRLHAAGNHGLCLAGNCAAVTRDKPRDKTSDGTRNTTRDPGRVGSENHRPPKAQGGEQ
jgi:hypothetical protein